MRRTVAVTRKRRKRLLDHPAPSLLLRFLSGDLSAEEKLSVVRHLLGGCERCSAAVGPAAVAYLGGATVAAGRMDGGEAASRRPYEALSRHGAKAPEIAEEPRRLHQQMSAKRLDTISLDSYPDHAIVQALHQWMRDL